MNRRPALLVLSLAVALSLAVPACTESQRKGIKHVKSGLIGLKRKVTLYDCNGTPIRTWHGRFKIEVQGAYLSFIDDDDHEIKVGGTVVVEEE